MTHIELENLASDYLEGTLSPAHRDEIEAHLAACAQCRDLVSEVRRVLELCRASDDAEPAPWLLSKILVATIGERKPSLRARLTAFFRPPAQPRIAYAIAMAVFSLSVIVNAAGINLRHFTAQDLNPLTWAHKASVKGHRLYARAEKFYYDLRVVYEIESRFRRTNTDQQEEKEPPKPEAPSGGSSDHKRLGDPQLASVEPYGAASQRQPVKDRQWQ